MSFPLNHQTAEKMRRFKKSYNAQLRRWGETPGEQIQLVAVRKHQLAGTLAPPTGGFSHVRVFRGLFSRLFGFN
jgi:hypothetical protein